ncbi:MAG: NAD-dependent epimerase/dehydratase family protein [Pseudomonadota bacterium]
MRALVTGIGGFIGFHVAARLAAAGHAVCGVDDFNDYYDVALKKARAAALPGEVAVSELDIADGDRFAAYVAEQDPDVVVHLAAQAGVRYSIENPFAYAHSNLQGHLSVLEACRRANRLSHLVYASSSSVYGQNSQSPFREAERADKPVSLYAATKRSSELLSESYAHLYGLKQIGLRFFTVYGPWGRPDMAYWIFTQRILAGEPIRVFNHGDMRRDFTYVDDVTKSIVEIVKAPEKASFDDTPHTVYNVGNQSPEKLMTMIDTLQDLTGRKAQLQFEGMQPGDVKETCADVSRLAADFGYNPSTPLATGLRSFVDWFRAHHGV